MRSWLCWRRVVRAAVTLLVCIRPAIAESPPRVPCDGGEPLPKFAALGATPNFFIWNERELVARWIPPPCTGWTSKEGVLVGLAGRFRYSGDLDDLLVRFGAISKMVGVQYWSIRDQRWQPLITNASALGGPDATRARPDFSLNEMKSGADLYFTETENRIAQPVVYRMRITLTDAGAIIATENVTPVQQFWITLLHPGDLQAVHFFTHESPGGWTYYGLARTAVPSLFLEPRQESYLNRALALYSYFTGTPPARVVARGN